MEIKFLWSLLLESNKNGKSKKFDYWFNRSFNSVIFVVLNTSPVAINFGFFKVKLPLIVVLVVMVIIGMVIAWFFGRNKNEKQHNKLAILDKNKKKN